MQRAGDSKRLLLPALTLAVLVTALGLLLDHPSLAPEQGAGDLLEITGQTMGTRYRVLVHADTVSPRQRDALGDDIAARLAVLDTGLFSTYAPDSQLSRLNRQSPGEPMLVAADMLTVLAVARDITLRSTGAFDVTVKPLVDLWGFGPDPAYATVPDADRIRQAMAATGMHRLEIDTAAGTVTRLDPVTLDLSAIAKGFAVDEVANLLERYGMTDYLVEIGGEVRLGGVRPGGGAWQVGIETPEPGSPSLFQALHTGGRSLGIATSGNYRNFYERDGIRYSHTIDPRTGRPVTHNLASVTVVAESAMVADAWATAMLVLGPEAGMELANELQLAVFFIVDGASGFSALHSATFNRFL